MADNSEDERIKGSVELVKLAYTDAFQPVAKEAGKAFETVGKMVNIALFPLNAVVWGYDKIQDFVQQKVSEKLVKRNVPPEDIVTPDPDVAVPTIEALRYSKLKDEYANLLATAMTGSRAGEAHPAYVEIIKQMVPDEAKVIKVMNSGTGIIPVIMLCVQKGRAKTYLSRNFGNILHQAQCGRTSDEETYFDNLTRLGLVEITFDKSASNKEAYQSILKSAPVVSFLSSTPVQGKPSYEEGVVMLTQLGRSFYTTCIE